ncbi:membrane-spanning 4-domains subfamily A member 8-like [Betta splendens]|uniref:Membrane-spanning 4-domains subfamily A member 8-like n=1 Tax=Betta splendens TaxID=158456 RepID=A0A6P7KWR8_BETSP|nr:membrane-spanning 4-domains subfamily A member 8-like [Betta splendens]
MDFSEPVGASVSASARLRFTVVLRLPAAVRMSISMSKADGVAVFTVTSDTKSSWPPLCQILKALCYSPVCCSVSERLRRIQGSSQTSLGILQIIVGLLNIGLGIILRVTEVYLFSVTYMLSPVWLGILFMLFGTVCILSEKFPSPCLVTINVISNLAGVAFAITAIVLYCISIGDIYFWRDCSARSWYYDRWPTPSPTPSSSVREITDKCLWYKSEVLLLLRGIIGVLIVLCTLQLCVTISGCILGIKALCKNKNKDTEDPELYKPLTENEATE